MTDDSMQKELEQLRAEVAALSAAGRQGAAPADTHQPAQPAVEQAGAATGAAEPVLPEEVKDQMSEFMELLEAEVRDLPTITCLAVFSLGILMGRWLR